MSLTTSVLLASRVFPSTYRDSVTLMVIASSLEKKAGVVRAGAVMGTPANLAILAAADMLPDGLNAGPDDIVIVVRADDPVSLDAAVAEAGTLLSAVVDRGDAAYEGPRPASVLEGMSALGDAGILAVSTPGAYAPLLVKQGLAADLHVFCFSDNVEVDDEVALKTLASERGLLLMGPDCGTALIDGTPLGFVNAVSVGPVGIVAASGTGAQEVMCQLDARSVGVSQVIGVGGRDLSAAVGGVMTMQAVDRLMEDPATECVVLVGKPPAPEVADLLSAKLAAASKPVFACLIGAKNTLTTGSLRVCDTLVQAAALAAATVTGEPEEPADVVLPALDSPSGQNVLGLFTGGTLAAEARYVLASLGVAAEVIDLGDDEYTVGRPHPMIDPTLRSARVAAAGADPEVGVVLADLVLGHGPWRTPLLRLPRPPRPPEPVLRRTVVRSW